MCWMDAIKTISLLLLVVIKLGFEQLSYYYLDWGFEQNATVIKIGALSKYATVIKIGALSKDTIVAKFVGALG